MTGTSASYVQGYKPTPFEFKAPPPGSNGSIYSTGAANNKAAAEQTQALLNVGNATGGGIPVPAIKAAYPEPGVGSNTVAGNMAAVTKNGATSYANAQYDHCAQPGACAATVTRVNGGGRSRCKHRYRYKQHLHCTRNMHKGRKCQRRRTIRRRNIKGRLRHQRRRTRYAGRY